MQTYICEFKLTAQATTQRWYLWRLNPTPWVAVLLALLFTVTAAAQYAIERIDLHAYDIPLQSPFETAKGSSSSCYGILITLHAVHHPSGRVVRGIGPILPRSLVSNETRRDAWAGAEAMREALLNRELSGHDLTGDMAAVRSWINDLDDVANRHSLATRYPPPSGKQLRATLCGFDTALLDLVGQLHDLPICELFSADGDMTSRRPAIKRAAPTFNASTSGRYMARRVATLHPDYDAMRIKVGLEGEDDAERLFGVARSIVEHGRTDLTLWIDANQSWKDAAGSIQQLEAIGHRLRDAGFTGLFIIEQPTHEHDLDALAEVTAATRSWNDSDRFGLTFAIMADEAVWNLDDVRRIVEKDAADMINIKMQKAGGFLACMDIGRYLARHAPDIGVYLGGLVMTDLGAWGNVQLSFALPRLDYQTSGAPRRNFPANIASNPLTYTYGRTIRRPMHSGLGTAARLDAFQPFVTQRSTHGRIESTLQAAELEN